jgi:enoyl-CoA hydratase
MNKTIKLETGERVATLMLNRPQTMNSINSQLMDELGEACQVLAADDQSRVVLITSSGRSFCSGLDLGLLGEIGRSDDSSELAAQIDRWQEVFNALERLPQITIAVINGPAIGAGVELLLCCDFRIASTRALFGMPELKFGLVPDLGGIPRLVRTVGPAWAKEILMRGRNLNPMEALRMGLINRVADPGDLNGTTKKWAGQFASLPPAAVRKSKELIRLSFDGDLAASLALAKAGQLELFARPEFRAILESQAAPQPGEEAVET